MNSVLTAPDLSPAIAREIEEALPTVVRYGRKIYDRKNQKVFRFRVANLDLIAKTYQVGTASRYLAATLGFSRARRSFRAGQLLLNAGILTPKPLLVKEEGCLLNSSSILITEFLDGTSLREHLKQGLPIPGTLTDDLVGIIEKLAQNNIRHGDFHDGNILIPPDGHPSLIDLDGTRKRFLKKKARQNIREDRDRLLLSLDHAPDFQAALIAKMGAPGSPLP